MSDLRPSFILHTPEAPLAHNDSKPRSDLAWSIDGGTVTVQLLFAALAPSLRPSDAHHAKERLCPLPSR